MQRGTHNISASEDEPSSPSQPRRWWVLASSRRRPTWTTLARQDSSSSEELWQSWIGLIYGRRIWQRKWTVTDDSQDLKIMSMTIPTISSRPSRRTSVSRACTIKGNILIEICPVLFIPPMSNPANKFNSIQFNSKFVLFFVTGKLNALLIQKCQNLLSQKSKSGWVSFRKCQKSAYFSAMNCVKTDIKFYSTLKLKYFGFAIFKHLWLKVKSYELKFLFHSRFLVFRTPSALPFPRLCT